MASLNRILEHIFGTNFLPSADNSDVKSGDFETILHSVNCQIESLNQNGETSKHKTYKSKKKIEVDQGDGRIGNAKVSVDFLELSNRVPQSESFKIIGVVHFGTVKTNCAVYRGKWQYEVLLLSAGVMQIGWATFNSKFDPGQGVGDTADSYAVDGSRVRKWNIAAEDYGEKWEEDDVIGCCLDLDEGCVEFFRNGRSMGVAYNRIQMGAGIAYFPAISLQEKEGVIANFGSTPFYYPVPGYRPIQEPPHKDLATITFLLDCTSKLLHLMDSCSITPDHESISSLLSHEAVLMELGKILVSNITPFLTNPYIVENKLIPFIRGLCEMENVHVNQGHVRPSARVAVLKSTATWAYNSRKMNIFLDMIWAFTEINELKAWTSTLVSRLSSRLKHTIRPLNYEFSHQKDATLVLHSFLNHKKVRHFLMNHVLFEGMKFLWFMNIKVPPNESNLFWETDPSIEINKRTYAAAVNRISSAINSLEEMQVEILLTMLDNTDGSSTKPSSRKIFLDKFRTLRRQFYALYRVNPHKSPGSPFFLAWPFFLRLLRVLELLWPRDAGSGVPDVVPPSKFYDGSISYFDIDRLGGVLLYLLKTFLSNVEQRLGGSIPVTDDHANTGTQSNVDSSTSTARNLTGPLDLANFSTRIFDMVEDVVHIDSYADQLERTNISDDTRPLEQPLNPHNFLSEILDGLILLYHMSHKTNSPTHCAISHHSKVKDLVQSLSEIKDAMNCFHSSSKHEPDVLKTLELSYNVLLDHLQHTTCYLTTLHAMRYPCRQSWLFKVVLNTLKTSAEDLHLFTFVPEFYLDCLIDILKELSTEAKPTFISLEESPDYDLLQGIVQFICDHIDDQRVRIAKAKDTLLIALLDIVTTPNLVEVLHGIPADSRMNMIRFLLQPYENRAWANSNWILVRIWHGSPNSFACGAHWSMYHKFRMKLRPLYYPINSLNVSLDCDPFPSAVLQEQIQSLIISEPDIAITFLNSALNQLNWAFSEFIGMLQKLQNASNRQERVLVESRQLIICSTCFDLTVALLRVLEMVAVLAPPMFVSPDQPNSCFMLARLYQLLCQVLNRASSQDGCFHHITSLEIPGLENVVHFPILTAVCGILLAILKDDIENFQASSNAPVPKVTKILLMEPSFQLSSFTFLLEENPHLFSLKYYREHMTSEEITTVQKMLTMLIHYHPIVADSCAASNSIEDDKMCTICFAFPISAKFEPCKHNSCRACITHHLMNCSDCFFCKAIITKVIDDEGKVIYNTEQEHQLTGAGSSGN